jgi:hypothetical protein
LLLLFSGQLCKAQCATPTSTIVNNSSCTAPNGKITFTAPTPTANYLFSINGGISFGTVGQTVFTGLIGGDYHTVSKNISSGCISTQTIKTLSNPANPVAPTSAVINNTNCNAPNGRITFSAPAPVANYQFSIDGGVTFGTAGQTVFNNLTGGSYPTVVKLVSSGCVSAAAVKAITNPAVTAPTSTVINVTNCNTPNGRITFTAPTPVANYQFSIDGGVTFGTAGQTVFNGLSSGTYATKAKLISTGCISAAVSKAVTNPVVTVPTSATTNVTNCNTPNGRITFSAPTPVANYQFSINGGATFGTAGQTIFPGLAAGTYVTKAKLISSGCISAAVNKVIANPTVTAPTSAITNPTNCNTPNGIITFSAPTPVANYQFSVNSGVSFGTPGQTVFNGLAAGTYATRAKLVSSGCISAAVSKVLANPVVTVPVSAVTTSSCSSSTGSITFSAPTPLANYQFSIDGGVTFGTTGQTVFNGLAAGIYATKSKLASSGCISTAVNKTIATTPVAAPTSAVVNLTNCNTPNGSITFSAPAPTANYQFSVDGGATFGTTGQTVFNGLDDGIYSTVARLVSSGCVSPAANKTITKPAVTAPTSTVVNVTTCAAPNGNITFTAPTPLANYQFSIDNGATFGGAGVTVFPNLDHAVYPTVAKLVSSGCVSAAVNKTVNAPVLAGADQSICLDQTVTMAGNVAAGAGWLADPGNPAAVTIATPASNVTTVTGFTATGIYNFFWKNATCADTMTVEVADCASPLACSNQGYLFQSMSGSGTDFISVNLQTGAFTTLYTDITLSPFSVNAIGYNVTDGHIWGAYLGAAVGTIARIGADGKVVTFPVTGLPAGGFNVGTIDNDGVLYLYTSNTTDIYRVDVNPASPTYLTILPPVLNTIAMAIADWAYNPIDDRLYGVNTNAAAPLHQLLRINPLTGVVTVVGTVSGNAAFQSGSFGAAYLDGSGNLYVSDNVAGGIYKLSTVQNIFGNATAAAFSQGVLSNGNDGALCQYTCVQPNAGTDTTICIRGAATMTADSVSGIQWTEQPGNPGTSVIADPSDAHTVINGFSAPGVYYYLWQSNSVCSDTVAVTVYACVLDSIIAEPSCEVLTICPTAGPIPPDAATVYSTCGLDPSEAAEGTFVLDGSGCATWTPFAPLADTISTCIITCNGLLCDTSFVFIAPCSAVVPISLADFRGSATGCDAVLVWATAQEENSDYFEIQRRTGNTWKTIKRVAAAGTSSALRTYTEKAEIISGVSNYFRLRLVDKDGRAGISKVITLKCNGSKLQIWPNPVADQLFISGLSANNTIRLTDAAGATISVTKTNGSNSTISMGQLSAGTYLVQVIDEKGVSIAREKIVKQ